MVDHHAKNLSILLRNEKVVAFFLFLWTDRQRHTQTVTKTNSNGSLVLAERSGDQQLSLN